MKTISLFVQALFYAAAGLNHFVNPAFYLPLIPPWLPEPEFLNAAAGVTELVAAGLLLFPASRRAGVLLILAMLTAFIPAHVFMIQTGGCIEGSLCVPLWMVWLRLVVVQPVLMFWAWFHR